MTVRMPVLASQLEREAVSAPVAWRLAAEESLSVTSVNVRHKAIGPEARQCC